MCRLHRAKMRSPLLTVLLSAIFVCEDVLSGEINSRDFRIATFNLNKVTCANLTNTTLFADFADALDLDVMLIQEHRCEEPINKNLTVTGKTTTYQLFVGKAPNANTAGVGALVHTRNEVKTQNYNETSSQLYYRWRYMDIVWNRLQMRIFNLYAPQGKYKADCEAMWKLINTDVQRAVKLTMNTEFFVAGDMNARYASNNEPVNDSDNNNARLMEEFLDTYGFTRIKPYNYTSYFTYFCAKKGRPLSKSYIDHVLVKTGSLKMKEKYYQVYQGTRIPRFARNFDHRAVVVTFGPANKNDNQAYDEILADTLSRSGGRTPDNWCTAGTFGNIFSTFNNCSCDPEEGLASEVAEQRPYQGVRLPDVKLDDKLDHAVDWTPTNVLVPGGLPRRDAVPGA